ncbi:MAG: chorismate-binding protein, partial [Planctomycetota bacterium]
PASDDDLLGNPDYELYFADNIFLMDHEQNQGYVVVNVMITDGDRESIMAEAQECFDYYNNLARFDVPHGREFAGEIPAASTDTDQDHYEQMVKTAKRHILDGDIFQVVLSRTKMEPCPDEPLDVYKRLRHLNPSPYMFYLNTPNTILMGSSPELNLRVSGTEQRSVEIRPIAGTKPRGRVGGEIDQDTDFRYEAELETRPQGTGRTYHAGRSGEKRYRQSRRAGQQGRHRIAHCGKIRLGPASGQQC